MSLKKVRQVKEEKPFRLADLIVYGVIAAVAAALFIAVFALRDDGDLQGVRIYVKNEVVFEYDFGRDEYSVFGDCAEVADGEKLTVRIASEGGYNVVEIDKSARSARMADADCRNRDCVFSGEIADAGGMIYCSPHHVRIQPYGGDGGKSLLM